MGAGKSETAEPPAPSPAAILDQLPEFVFVVGPDHRIRSVHGQWPRILGPGADQILGRRFSEAFPGTSPDPETEIAQALDGHLVATQWSWPHPTREVRALQVTLSPLREGAKLAGAVGVARDVTEQLAGARARADSEENLHQLQRMKQMDELRARFINTAAHELRTPLTPIKLQIHVLKTMRAGGSDPDGQKSLEILERNVDRLGQLVQDVLDGARLQSGNLKLARRVVDLNQIAQEAVESFQEPARQAGLELSLRAAKPLAVDVDANRITQVFFNLLSNAVKYAPSGASVTVTLQAADRRAVVTVADTGPGLTREQMGRLFQPFSQVHDPMQSTRPGTGLGLYISKGILELHGGTIGVDSPGPGRGSTFTFDLPLSDGPIQPLPARRTPRAAKPTGAEALSRRVRDLI